MARGRVDRWNGQTGFLIDEADRGRVFFGDRGLRGLRPQDVRVGMELEFEREEAERGPRAFNVRRPGGAPAPRPPRSAPPTPAPGGIPEPPVEWAWPRSSQALLRQVPLGERHPGLQLDRLAVPGDQERQRQALLDVTQAPGSPAL